MDHRIGIVNTMNSCTLTPDLTGRAVRLKAVGCSGGFNEDRRGVVC
jgi:hypothetical protein